MPSSACSAGWGASSSPPAPACFRLFPAEGCRAPRPRSALARTSLSAEESLRCRARPWRKQDGREGGPSGGSQGPPASATAAASAVLGGLKALTAR